MGLKFSNLTQENYLQAFKLQETCHQFPWSESVFADCLMPPYRAFQLLNDNSVVGYYVALMVLDEATLMDIGVASESRGKGFGDALLGHFLQQCDQGVIKTIWLEVRSSNASAINLYNKHGFIEIERRKDYYPATIGREDAVMMRRGQANS